jgi:hypothetical protein
VRHRPKRNVTIGAQYRAPGRAAGKFRVFCPSQAVAELAIACFNSSGLGRASERTTFMRKILPDTMFADPERSRLSLLRTWVLDNAVTEIEMNERQFWNFAHLQPTAEKPWVTFMGRVITVTDMPVEAQKQLGIFDKRNPAAI